MYLINLRRHLRAGVLGMAVLSLGLAGCSSSSSDDDDDNGGSGSAVIVIGASGDGVTMTGTWFGCSDDGGSDFGTQYVFEGLGVTVTSTTYSSNDQTCSTGETADGEFVTDASVLDDQEIYGWSDGSSLTTAPDRADAGGALDDPPTVTPVELSQDGSVLGTLVLLVDDTGDTDVLYRDHDEPAQCAEVDGVVQCLHSIDTLERQ